eukprot:TRINITY_DN9327_c0_g1_i1.p1 TRINITY_DN9327_c0_g1~~TRINITY_DN9327_c0_g1_i1.p1  ORF type:complete len:170 (-),score=53.77 TRINITY_DN9327_c0_g1_i1:404-865(-)
MNGYPINISGLGGKKYGDKELNCLYLGSGGGSGFTRYNKSVDGGNGGGAVILKSKILINEGVIESNGTDGDGDVRDPSSSGGGGGSGGSILISCMKLINRGSILAKGGKGGGIERQKGGDGGDGRIRINHVVIQKGHISPEPFLHNQPLVSSN